MSDLPNTLEEMQRDILQGDLKNNPYLQGSTIPTRDKELKTKAKKIIPAINELLKMINTFSDSINDFMDNVNSEVDGLRNDMKKMSESIKELSNSDEDKNKKIDELNKKYDECIKKTAEIELDIKLMKCCCMNKSESLEGDIMELMNKVKLQKGESTVIGSIEELYDPKKQIKIYAYEENSKNYKFINYEFKVETWGNNVHQFEVTPIELQLNEDGNEVILVNKSSWEVIVLIYK